MASFHEIKTELESWSAAAIGRRTSASRLAAADYIGYRVLISIICFFKNTCACWKIRVCPTQSELKPVSYKLSVVQHWHFYELLWLSIKQAIYVLKV